MTRIPHAIKIPDHLFGCRLPLPCERQAAHSKEPSSLAVHRMLGFTDQQEGRVLVLTRASEGAVPTIHLPDGTTIVPDLPLLQLLAALSFLEGDQIKGVLRLVKGMQGETPGSELAYEQVLKGVMTSAQRKILNAWDGREERSPWSGVGIIPMAPDGSEFAFARKDHLHPRATYCGRLSLIGGNIDPNEIISDWGDQAAAARVGMLRECFEEIRILEIANEITTAARYFGPARATCYLYEDDGQPTEGTIRAFLAPAPSTEAWDRWRRIFTKEVDGLGEADPQLVTLAELRGYFRQDAAEAKERSAYLKSRNAAEVQAAEAALTACYSWKRVHGLTRLKHPDLDDETLSELTGRAWRAIREDAQAQNVFPMGHRGNFAFIAGHAGPIAHVLRGMGIET